MTIYYSFVDSFGNEFYSRAMTLLPNEKSKQIARLKNEKAKKESILAWLLFRFACDEQKIENRKLGFEKNGKPFLCSGQMQFNLTHSDGLSMCAVSKSPVGIDAEKKRTFSPSLLKRITGEKEHEAVLKSDDANCYSTKLWTLKESFFKQSGEGLCAGLKTTDFSKVLFENEFDLYGLHFESFELEDFLVSVCGAKERAWLKKVDFENAFV